MASWQTQLAVIVVSRIQIGHPSRTSHKTEIHRLLLKGVITIKTVERQVEPSMAIARAIVEITAMGLHHEIVSIRNDQGIQTYRCILYDTNGNKVSVGNGKGLGEQSLASALFEAIEHYFVAYSSHENVEDIEVSQVLDSNLFSTEAAFRPMATWNPSIPLSCRRYTSLHDESEIYYPAFLSAPGSCLPQVSRSALAPVRKYATNNGTATGMSKTEALIHSISEIIERDAISCFLLKTFISKESAPVILIDRNAVPSYLFNLMRASEFITGEEMVVLDITTEFGIPTALAFFHKSNYPVPFVGSGASLSKRYAVERAILEAIQSFHLYDKFLYDEDVAVIQSFKNLPRYQRCVQLDLTNCDITVISYDDMASCEVDENLEEYLQQQIDRVSSHKYHVYYHDLYRSASGISCVHCIIPGLEKFHLVRNGIPVLPSERGERWLR